MRCLPLAMLVLASFCGGEAIAWGDDGHKTVALIAQQCLTASAKTQVTAMLRSDTDDLTQHDIASAATWADKYREFNKR